MTNGKHYHEECNCDDPCSERKACIRESRRQNSTIVLIAVLIAASIAGTFALFASGVLVWNSVEDKRVVGVPATPDCDDCGAVGNGDVTINTDNIGITTDKIVVQEDKKRHNND